MDTPNPTRTSLAELAWVFLVLGATAFGGPAAHIALMQRELVERREWLSEERFVDLLSITNLIPGPNSTELAFHLGYDRGGNLGAVVAGVCFILPAAVITLICAWMYVEYGTLPTATAILAGVKPVILAIIGLAILNLGRTLTVKGWPLWIALLTAILGWRFPELTLWLLLGGGLVGIAKVWWEAHGPPKGSVFVLLPIVLQAGGHSSNDQVAPTLLAIGLYFLRLGSVLYGSGYVLTTFLQQDLVTDRGWLTSSQLLDLIAIGQVTPGPVFTTATAIGYVLAGPVGAVVATLGIFLPGAIFVLLTHGLIEKLRGNPYAAGFLDAVNGASIGLMAAILPVLAVDALTDPVAWVLAIGSLIVLIRTECNPTWLLGAGALIGAVQYR